VVKLTRIYTKTGDDGTTSLGDMSRTSKNDPRLEAYATVDEANSQLGLVLSLGTPEEDVAKLLVRIQNDLFDVGADLCVPVIDKPSVEPLRVTVGQVEALETAIDKFNAELSSLRSFILPGGNPTAALMHVARTTIRRAEREAWAAIHAFGQGVNPLTARYLNRLSDLLFVLARYANRHEGDQLWVPGANR
jgi:cob(I)alamin adenosyltransferase